MIITTLTSSPDFCIRPAENAAQASNWRLTPQKCRNPNKKRFKNDPHVLRLKLICAQCFPAAHSKKWLALTEPAERTKELKSQTVTIHNIMFVAGGRRKDRQGNHLSS